MLAKLELYRIFLECAHQQSFSKASERLFISQSAVSQAVKQLERELGCNLVIRSAKGVSLSKEGEVLFDYVEHALSLIEQGEHHLNQLQHLNEGTLSIGAGDTISSNFLLPFLEEYHRLYPKVKIELINRTTIEMVELIQGERVDLAFLNLPIQIEGIEIKECLAIHDIFVSAIPPDKKTYTRKESAQQPLILLERQSNSRLYIQNEFLKEGIDLKPQIELGAHEVLLNLAQIKLGVSCVIKEFSKRYLEEGLIYEWKLDNPLPARHIGVGLKGNCSRSAQAFLDLVLSKEK